MGLSCQTLHPVVLHVESSPLIPTLTLRARSPFCPHSPDEETEVQRGSSTQQVTELVSASTGLELRRSGSEATDGMGPCSPPWGVLPGRALAAVPEELLMRHFSWDRASQQASALHHVRPAAAAL